MYCKKCGSEIQEGKKFCGDCGVFYDDSLDNKINENNIQQEEMLESEMLSTEDLSGEVYNKKGKRTIIILSIISFVLLAGGIISAYFCNEYKSELEKTREIQYQKDLKEIVLEIMDQSIEIENIIKTGSEDWKRVVDISKNADDKKYDISAGLILSRAANDIFKIKDGRTSVDRKVKELNQPPEKYKDSYNIAMEIYDYYIKYEEMTEFPSGSLDEFTQKTDDLSEKLVKKVHQFGEKISLKLQ